MTDSAFLNVNQHYLDRVIDLTSVRDVEAAEDIYAANGMKLVAKGARLSSALQERLIVHKLKKPLESSIQVADGVNNDFIRNSAAALLERIPDLHPLIGKLSTQDSPLKLLGCTHLNQALSLMLTLVDRAGESVMTHCLLVSLVSYGLARQTGADINLLETVVSAGLLHDIGELYINPMYLNAKNTLAPSEWRHLVVHPVIAQKLLLETSGLPPTVAQAVLEHHERYNGLGYPRQLHGHQASRAGQIVAAAEMIAAVFLKRDAPLARADLALKIVPGEHAPELVTAVSQALHSVNRIHEAQLPSVEPLIEALTVVDRFQQARGWINQQLAGGQLAAQEADLLELVNLRLVLIERVFSSTGMDMMAHCKVLPDDIAADPICFEMHLIANEVIWRLRDLARDLALKVGGNNPQLTARYSPIIELLNGPTIPDGAMPQAVPA